MTRKSNWLSEQPTDIGGRAEKRAGRIVTASAILSSLVVVCLMFWARRGSLPPPMRICFFPILLWSLIAAAHSFWNLLVVARRRTEALKEIAKRDSITGAYSDDYLREKLEDESRRARGQGGAAAVAHIRCLGLAEVNADYGLTTGNVVLRGLADVIAQSLPSQCVVARLGGSVFGVLMRDMTPEAALSASQEAVNGIRSYRLDLGGRGIIDHLDASVGISTYPYDDEDPREITRLAELVCPQQGSEAACT